MQRHFLIAIFTLTALTSFSQKKPLTNEQYFKNNFKGIQNNFPQITWLDDTKYVMKKNGNNAIFDAKSGKEEAPVQESKSLELTKPLFDSIPFIQGNDLFIKINGVNIQLTFDEPKEVNPKMSPDNKYIAYTKNNDLYSLEISTKKENRLTTDGSDVILNGYASWVYYEEILGRGSRYKSFWWSPDSKTICFMRMDDTKVPLFPIYNESGQHGFTENTRYPKSGDNNPTVRIGITPAEGGNIVWADFNENQDQYFGLPYWAPDAKTVLIQWMNRGQTTSRSMR